MTLLSKFIQNTAISYHFLYITLVQHLSLDDCNMSPTLTPPTTPQSTVHSPTSSLRDPSQNKISSVVALSPPMASHLTPSKKTKVLKMVSRVLHYQCPLTFPINPPSAPATLASFLSPKCQTIPTPWPLL